MKHFKREIGGHIEHNFSFFVEEGGGEAVVDDIDGLGTPGLEDFLDVLEEGERGRGRVGGGRGGGGGRLGGEGGREVFSSTATSSFNTISFF